MSVKEVKSGDVSNKDNPLAKKQTRDIGSSGLDELVAKVQQKLENKVQPVTTERGSSTELGEKKTEGDANAKKAYFSKVSVEKQNMDTTAARALRGNLGGHSSGMTDARNLKLVVLPKLEKKADPTEVQAFGGKASTAAPFKFDLSDLLGRTMGEIEAKPEKFQKRLSKLEERAKLREKKFGKKIPPNDQDPNEFAEEEYNRRKKSRAVAKMFELMNKAMGIKMDQEGMPAGLMDAPKKKAVDDDDDGL